MLFPPRQTSDLYERISVASKTPFGLSRSEQQLLEQWRVRVALWIETEVMENEGDDGTPILQRAARDAVGSVG